MKPIFITGTGTGIGKTLVAAVVATALQAGYWKPVQAGTEDETDAETVACWLGKENVRIYPEVYMLRLPASPHLAAAREGQRINLDEITARLPLTPDPLVLEGAGGLCVPLNESEFVYDLIKKLGAQVVLVSRNYLGSINHSLLTAELCKTKGLPVLGWIFNDEYMQYEEEIARWSNFPLIGKLPHLEMVNLKTIQELADQIRDRLINIIQQHGL